MAIKLTGVRSVHTKLLRLADELNDDARRLMDTPDVLGHLNTADSLQWLAAKMRKTAKSLES